MKGKALMVYIVVLLALVTTLATISATDDFVRIDDIVIDGVSVFDGSGNVMDSLVAGTVGNNVPVEVMFTALKDAEDVKVKVYIEGFKNDISASTDRFKVYNGSTYVKRFTIELPSERDLDDLTEDISLLIRVIAQGEDSVEYYRTMELQRELYNIEFLSIESPDKVVPGSQIAVDVVLENTGDDRLNDIYVKATIPELGISRNVYVGDLGPKEETDVDYYENIRNAVEKRIYLAVPKSALAGTYQVELEAYNYDVAISAKKKIVVEGVSTNVLPSVTSKTVNIGEEVSFDVTIVNANDRTVIYTVTPEEAKGLIVEVSEPVVAVSADSSKTVKVNVKATNSADEGTHVVTVNVNSESGVSKPVSFSVNVRKESSQGTPTTPRITTNNTVLILTVVLAIIFVVLLVVLIVLLTKKPAESEEFGETSYY